MFGPRKHRQKPFLDLNNVKKKTSQYSNQREIYAWTLFLGFTKRIVCVQSRLRMDYRFLDFHKTCTICCCLFRAFSSPNYVRRCSAIFATKLGETILMQAMKEGGFFWRCFCVVSPHQQDSTSTYSSKLVF